MCEHLRIIPKEGIDSTNVNEVLLDYLEDNFTFFPGEIIYKYFGINRDVIRSNFPHLFDHNAEFFVPESIDRELIEFINSQEEHLKITGMYTSNLGIFINSFKSYNPQKEGELQGIQREHWFANANQIISIIIHLADVQDHDKGSSHAHRYPQLASFKNSLKLTRR